MASGDTLILFNAASNKPPASNAATLDTVNQHLVLDFDATTNESAIFSGVMPQHYAGGGVTVRIAYTMSSATADTIDWDADWEQTVDGDTVASDRFVGANSTDATTVPGTIRFLDTITITFTDGADMDSVSAGDMFRLKITRDATNDDATGDAELHWVEVQET